MPILNLESYKTYSFTYKGRGVSWNDIYGSNDWRKRKTLVDKYKKIFEWLLKEAKLPYLNQYAVILTYNSRHDVDNVGCMAKTCLDAMKGVYCPDDSPKYLKSLSIVYDQTLDKNTFQFTLIEL